MPPDEPSWWKSDLTGASGAGLRAAARTYGSVAKLRANLVTPYHSTLPVVCVGNFTAGGGGKTPLSMHLAQMLKEMGRTPAFLTRGYGGKTRGPHLVNAQHDTAQHVGDEPLLLAQHAPTWICADRKLGARSIEHSAADCIIMDDGFQNPGLHKDLSIIAFDASAQQPLGNRKVIPAGPLRAPLDWQIKRTDAVVFVTQVGQIPDTTELDDIMTSFPADRMFHASMSPIEPSGIDKASPIVAFSGIARPEKFFDTLRASGWTIAEQRAFSDHHAFSDTEITAILHACERHRTSAITTQKDAVRFNSNSNDAEALRKKLHVLKMNLEFTSHDEQNLQTLLEKTLAGEPIRSC